MPGLTNIVREARRRRVFRTAGIYIVAAWVAVQVFSEIFPAFDIPAGAIRYVWLGALIGLPIAIIFGWFYDVTAEGIVRTGPAADASADLSLRRGDYLLLAALAMTAAVAVYQLSGRVSEQEAPEEAGAHVADWPSIGVLPFENLSADTAQIYFVNGIHDALIADLSRISGLRVTSKTSVRSYAETAKSTEEICAELAISKVLRGAVARTNNDVTVSVTLMDCNNAEPLWNASYERNISDVLILQSEITRSIATAVEVVLTRDESELLARTRQVNPAAYEAYLRGMFHLEMITPQDMQLAEEYFSRALEIDRNSALAHWGMGRACRFQMQFGQGVPIEREPECRGHQFKALAINPDLPQVHLGLALSYWLYDYDWEAADASFQRALELNPNYAEAYMFYSHFLAHVLRWEESDQSIRRALELDPLNVFVIGLYGAQQHLTRRFDGAIATLSKLHEDVPGFGFGFDVLWYVHFKLGNYPESIQAASKHFSITMGMPEIGAEIERSFAQDGFEQAMLQLGENLEVVAEQQYIQGVFVALPFVMGGDADTAVKWLETAIEQHDPMMPYMGTLAGVERLADDPGFAGILARMNLSLPPESPTD